jgi:hypothetical protein
MTIQVNADNGINSHIPYINSLCLCAVRVLVKYLHTVTGLELMPGVVVVIQTFGDRINFHPHIHVLVTEGGTAPDGTFHCVSLFHDDIIRDLFTHEVFSLLLRKKLIGLRARPPDVPFVRRSDEDHLFYRRTENHRQDHAPSRADL